MANGLWYLGAFLSAAIFTILASLVVILFSEGQLFNPTDKEYSAWRVWAWCVAVSVAGVWAGNAIVQGLIKEFTSGEPPVSLFAPLAGGLVVNLVFFYHFLRKERRPFDAR